MSSIDVLKKLEQIQVSPFEISLVKRDITDFVLKELLKSQNYFQFKYREMVGLGLKLKADFSTDIGEDKEYVILDMHIVVRIPKSQIIELAKRKKLRMLKLPKPHPLTKQRMREMDERAERLSRELMETLEELEEEREK